MHALLVGLPRWIGNLPTLLDAADASFDVADDGDQALRLMHCRSYGVLLIGLRLPDMDGCHLIRSLRARNIDSPVMAFTTQADAAKRTKALTAGANDVLTWPAEIAELRGRLQSVLRRSQGPSRAVIRLGSLAVDLDAMTATAYGRPICLTGKEFTILQLLVRQPGRSMTKDAIYRRVYGGNDGPEMKIIDVFVCKIRRKLEFAGAHGLLRTIRGVGYALCDNDQADSPGQASRYEPCRWIA